MDWISVKDKFPEEGEEVLIINKDIPGYIRYKIDYLIHLDDNDPPYIWACTRENEWDKITHWMQLPKLPKEG